MTVKDTATILVRALRRIEGICRADVGPFIYHIGRAGKPIRMD